MAKRPPAPETCPVCGEDVPRNALACPECGADHESGWREDAGSIDALGDRDDGFDYEEFTAREFGGDEPAKAATVHWVWWIASVVLLVVTAWLLVRG
jgi:hypothetical protein